MSNLGYFICVQVFSIASTTTGTSEGKSNIKYLFDQFYTGLYISVLNLFKPPPSTTYFVYYLIGSATFLMIDVNLRSLIVPFGCDRTSSLAHFQNRFDFLFGFICSKSNLYTLTLTILFYKYQFEWWLINNHKLYVYLIL